MKAAALSLLLFASCARAAQAPLSLVLVTMESVRADRVGVYGYGRRTTPALDALAREGARFSNAYAASGWTLPSLAALWTARVPEFSAVPPHMRLNSALESLPAALARAGFRTGAFVHGLPADRALGLVETFGHVDAGRHSEFAGPLVDRAIAWLEGGDAGKPFFLWLHTFDTHLPYVCPKEARERFGRGYAGPLHDPRVDEDTERHGRFVAHFNGTLAPERRDPGLSELVSTLKARPRDLRHFSDHYDGCLRHTDAQLARLFAALRARGLEGRTIVAATSDHGESLPELGGGRTPRVSHGGDLYEDVLRVPLIVRHPRRWRGRVFEEPVSLLDLAPTLLAALGAPALARAQGRDLAPWLDGAAAPRDFVYASDWQGRWIRALRRGGWKWLQPRRGPAKIFELESDRFETRDLAAQRPDVFIDLAGRFLGLMTAGDE